MAKLKALPKAILVGFVVAGVGFGVYKFGGLDKPKVAEAPPPPPPTQVAATPAPAPEPPQVVQAPPPVRDEPAVEAAAPIPATAQQLPVQTMAKLPGAGIASGQKTGTNWPMTEDIVKTCTSDKYPLRNNITNGTLDNINKVYVDPNSQFGIAQVDGLIAQKKVDPKMMSRILTVFPFFSVEVHAIAADGSKINSLADLQGKRVVEGPEGSGTNITVQLIKEYTGITWETVPGNLSQADGLKAVQTGAADVEFIVAGQPISVLTNAKGIKLIPLSHPKIDATGNYTKAQLPTGTYPWQKNSVSTYKVDNALITFAYKNQYQKEIGDLVTCITKNMDNLQATGHPKWRDVDPLDIDRIKWPSHPAAVAAIKREAKRK